MNPCLLWHVSDSGLGLTVTLAGGWYGEMCDPGAELDLPKVT